MSPVNLRKNPHAIVEIDGVAYDSWEQKQLTKSVSVELPTNETAEGRWTIFDPKFRVIDQYSNADAIPLATVRIFLGYGQNLGEPIFKGLLAHVERVENETTFVAFDMGFKMKLVKKAGYKNKKDDLAILKDLAARNGLQFEGPEKPLKLEPHKAMMQDEQTDWEHAMERARDAGLVIFVRQDTMFAKYPAKVGTPVLRLENHKDFVLQRGWDLMYRTPESRDGRPKIIKMRGRGKAAKRLEGESSASNRGHENVILKRDVSGKATKAKLSARAQAQKELDREHAFQGRIETVFPLNGERLDVRNTIQLDGIGKLFSGKYICDTVGYKFEAGKLGLDLDLCRDING